MEETLKTIEALVGWTGAVAGLGTLAFALINMLIAQRRSGSSISGPAGWILRTPTLIVASVLFVGIEYLLWRPIPLPLKLGWRGVLLVAGSAVYFSGLALYLWGMHTLRLNFNVSSGFGVRLTDTHQLITQGPFRYVRHPMYLGVILVGWGGLPLYRTWSMLFFAVIMLGLVRRANMEDRTLAQKYGDDWGDYAKRVPGWIPRLGKLS